MLVQLQLSKRIARSYDRPRVNLTFVVFAVLAAYQPAKGQESLQLPTLELSKPGVAEAIPNDVMPPNDAPRRCSVSIFFCARSAWGV